MLAALLTVAFSGSSAASGSAPPPARVRPSESPKAFLFGVYKPCAVQDARGIFQMTPEVLLKFFEPKLGAALLQTYSTTPFPCFQGAHAPSPIARSTSSNPSRSDVG